MVNVVMMVVVHMSHVVMMVNHGIRKVLHFGLILALYFCLGFASRSNCRGVSTLCS